jgi:hypothetical protein
MIELRGLWVFNNGKNSGYLSVPYLVLERDEIHYYRRFGGFAISRETYDYAMSRGVEYYEIHYLAFMNVLIFRLEDFRQGQRVMFSGELQYVLPKSRAIMSFPVKKFVPQHMEPVRRDPQ